MQEGWPSVGVCWGSWGRVRPGAVGDLGVNLRISVHLCVSQVPPPSLLGAQRGEVGVPVAGRGLGPRALETSFTEGSRNRVQQGANAAGGQTPGLGSPKAMLWSRAEVTCLGLGGQISQWEEGRGCCSLCSTLPPTGLSRTPWG